MTFKSDKKNALEVLVRMSLQDKNYSLFRETFQLMNPKLTDEDFKPMFPEGWSDDNNWPVIKNDYNSFRTTQISIDEWNEKMAGC